MPVKNDFVDNVKLTSAQTNDVLTNSGLVYVGERTATTGTSLTYDGCFTSDFSCYKLCIVMNNVSTGNTGLELRLRTSTPSDVSTNYFYSGYDIDNYNAVLGSFVSGSTGTGGTSFMVNPIVQLLNEATVWVDIYRPQQASFTYFYSVAGDTTPSGGFFNGYTVCSTGFHNLATSYSGIKVMFTDGGISTRITAVVYGYRQD